MACGNGCGRAGREGRGRAALFPPSRPNSARPADSARRPRSPPRRDPSPPRHPSLARRGHVERLRHHASPAVVRDVTVGARSRRRRHDAGHREPGRPAEVGGPGRQPVGVAFPVRETGERGGDRQGTGQEPVRVGPRTRLERGAAPREGAVRVGPAGGGEDAPAGLPGRRAAARAAVRLGRGSARRPLVPEGVLARARGRRPRRRPRPRRSCGSCSSGSAGPRSP